MRGSIRKRGKRWSCVIPLGVGTCRPGGEAVGAAPRRDERRCAPAWRTSDDGQHRYKSDRGALPAAPGRVIPLLAT